MNRTPASIYFELLVTVGLFVFPAILLSAFYFLHGTDAPGHEGSSEWQFGQRLVMMLLMLLLLWHIIRLNGEQLSDFSAPFTRNSVLMGVALWIAGMMCYVVFAQLLRAVLAAENRSALSPQNIGFLKVALGPFYLASIIVNPFFEEFFMRGFLQTRLRQANWDSISIVLASTMLQAAYHLYQGIVPATLLGVVFLLFAFFYQKTRQLWAVAIAHFVMDAFAAAALAK